MIWFIPLFAALAGFTAAQFISCDGNRYPDPNDCEVVRQNFMVFTNPPDGSGLCTRLENNYCLLYTYGNCQAALCPWMAEETCAYSTVLQAHYTIISSDCFPIGAGGRVNDELDKNYLEVYNNPDFDPESTAAKTLTNMAISIDEWEAKKNRSETGPIKRDTDPAPLARRDIDDTSLEVFFDATNIENDGARMQVSGQLPAGSDFIEQSTETFSYSMEISASVTSGFLGIIEVTVSASYSQSYQYSRTTGLNVYVDCEPGQNGIVYYYPLQRQVQGIGHPSGEYLTIWIPQENGFGNYHVQCLG